MDASFLLVWEEVPVYRSVCFMEALFCNHEHRVKVAAKISGGNVCFVKISCSHLLMCVYHFKGETARQMLLFKCLSLLGSGSPSAG